MEKLAWRLYWIGMTFALLLWLPGSCGSITTDPVDAGADVGAAGAGGTATAGAGGTVGAGGAGGAGGIPSCSAAAVVALCSPSCVEGCPATCAEPPSFTFDGLSPEVAHYCAPSCSTCPPSP